MNEKRTLFNEIYLDIKRSYNEWKYKNRVEKIKKYLDQNIKDNDIIYPVDVDGRWVVEHRFPILYNESLSIPIPKLVTILYFGSLKNLSILKLTNKKANEYFGKTIDIFYNGIEFINFVLCSMSFKKYLNEKESLDDFNIII